MSSKAWRKIFENNREEYLKNGYCPCCGRKGVWKTTVRDFKGEWHELYECRRKNCKSQL